MIDRQREGRQRAENLSRAGDLTAAVRVLVDSGLTTEASDLLDVHAVRLVSQARYGEVRELVGALPAVDRSLTARIADIDAGRHEEGVTSGDLERLIAEAQLAGRIDLRGWACAILVEHLLLEGDLTCVVLAARYLAEMPDDPMPPVLLLQARGRLRRLLGLAFLASGPSNEQLAQEELQRAIADFRRASWHTERWISVSLFYLFHTAVSWSAPPHVVHAVREARDQLIALDSSQSPFARYVVAFTAFSNGDLPAIRTELAELHRMDLNGEMEAAPVVAGYLEALTDAVLGGHPAAVERLGEAEEMRRSAPAMIGSILVKAAHALLDLGRPDLAAAWHGRLVATPPMLPYESAEREVVAGRVALGRGDLGAISRVMDGVSQLAATAYPRVTAGLALRSAMDAARAGLFDEAEVLYRQAEKVLPPVSERSAWERVWIRGYEQARAGLPVVLGPEETPAGPVDDSTLEQVPGVPTALVAEAREAPTRSLRVLAPSVEVTIDGQTRRLAPNVARLLVSLAALGRAVGAEELADLLWGDVDPSRARGRLKSALHRLRQALSLEVDELVVRRGDVVRLVPDPRWSVDLHDFHRFADGDAEHRLQAFRLVDGLLCNAQFPYDDVLAEERDVIAVRWTRLAEELTARAAVEPHEVRRRAQHLGLVMPAE